MKWVKRGLWAAAWGCWVWLGVGLFHGMPRGLGTPVSALDLVTGENVLGFMANENVIVTQPEVAHAASTTYRLWDAPTGRLLREIRGPAKHNFLSASIRHGVVVGVNMNAGKDQTLVPSTGALDLRSGKWTSLPREITGVLSYHPTKPWAVCSVATETGRPQRILVCDLATGNKVGEWSTGTAPTAAYDEILACECFPHPEQVLVLVRRPSGNPGDKDAMDLVASALEPKASRPTFDPPVGCDWMLPPTSNGLVIVGCGEVAPSKYEVLDLQTKRPIVSSNDIDPEGNPLEHLPLAPRLTQDGRTLLTPSGKLLDLAAHRVAWRAHEKWERPMWGGHDETPAIHEFYVAEDWGELIQHEPGLSSQVTWAVRDADSGALKWRLWDPEGVTMDSILVLPPQNGLLVTSSGVVYRFPVPPNYPLLALCQTILALPLVLLWAGLRWRRMRRMRLAGAAA